MVENFMTLMIMMMVMMMMTAIIVMTRGRGGMWAFAHVSDMA
jgi:hypothetical protein